MTSTQLRLLAAEAAAKGRWLLAADLQAQALELEARRV